MCTFKDYDVAQYLIIVEKGKSLSFVQVVYIGPIAEETIPSMPMYWLIQNHTQGLNYFVVNKHLFK